MLKFRCLKNIITNLYINKLTPYEGITLGILKILRRPDRHLTNAITNITSLPALTIDFLQNGSLLIDHLFARPLAANRNENSIDTGGLPSASNFSLLTVSPRLNQIR